MELRLPQLARDLLRDPIIGIEVCAHDLHVDGRRRTHADHGIHQAARGEKRRDLRHLSAHALLDFADVFVAADPMVRLQTHLDEAGVHRGVRRIDRGEAVIHADVVDDDRQVFGPDDLFDQALQIGHFLLGDRELGPGRRLEGDDELTGVGLREIGEPELAVQAAGSPRRR